MMGHGSLPALQRYLAQLRDDLVAEHARHSPVAHLMGGLESAARCIL